MRPTKKLVQQLVTNLENCRNVLGQAVNLGKFGEVSTDSEDSREEVESVIDRADEAIDKALQVLLSEEAYAYLKDEQRLLSHS
jgi:hypothetical protein